MTEINLDRFATQIWNLIFIVIIFVSILMTPVAFVYLSNLHPEIAFPAMILYVAYVMLFTGYTFGKYGRHKKKTTI